MATMKAAHHDMLKEQWRTIIKNHNQSGLTVKVWCQENQVSQTQYYYWLRVIRQESLIQAGTLAVTGQTQFAEIKQPSVDITSLNHQGICAILRSNGNEIEIINGADSNTLEVILRILGRS